MSLTAVGPLIEGRGKRRWRSGHVATIVGQGSTIRFEEGLEAVAGLGGGAKGANAPSAGLRRLATLAATSPTITRIGV